MRYHKPGTLFQIDGIFNSIKILFLFLILIYSVFAEELWTYSTESSVKYLLSYTDNLVALTENGHIHNIRLSTGKKIWDVGTAKNLVEPRVFDGDLVVASNNGRVWRLNKDGVVVWQRDIILVEGPVNLFGIEVSGSNIFATTNYGLLMLNRDGNYSLTYPRNSSIVTPPAISGTQIVFGADDNLVVLKNTNSEKWVKKVSPFWLSRPVIDGNNVYIGALDNVLYNFQLSDGFENWKYETRGWVLGDVLIDNNVYIASNDGVVYSLTRAGKLSWKAQTSEGISLAPTIGFVAGKKSIIVGSDDLYAIDPNNGEIIWVYDSKFDINDLITIDSRGTTYILSGSKDNAVTAFQVDRTCTIEFPTETDVLGYKEIKVRGKVASNFASPQVAINANGVQLAKAKINGNHWEYNLDPSKLNSGSNILSCAVSDSSGSETVTELFVKRDSKQNKGRFIISSPQVVATDKEFVVHVSDGDDSKPVEDFKVDIEGTERTETGNFSVSLSSVGKHSLVFSKIGYDDFTLTVEAKSPNDTSQLILPIAGGVVVLLVIVVVYFKVLKKKK
ncbi:MAG TPA: PQQ-binding-like beta-propeller repeat protein [Candidatus Bilamarchaeaceae archaeon]|nr:PQQ-binding-like beta-propeller repeat protein [Candidatus Bilamarchaeaceae archaeon]